MSTGVDLRVEQVHALIDAVVAPLVATETEAIALDDALGRVLGEDIVSPVDVPPHDNSAMDGYAFAGDLLEADDTGASVVALRIVGTAPAGTVWRGPLQAGDGVRIMTGAMLPCGLDTVVPQESCGIAGDVVRFPSGTVRRVDNRRRAWEDLRRGEPALRRGERLAPAALGLIASLGIARVKVMRRLRVAVLSTGDEILQPGEAPREGAVYDSNRFALLGLLRRLGCETIDLGRIGDDPDLLTARLHHAADRADAILSSGGASTGAADHTRPALQRLGDVAFWRVAMRPGRPLTVGRIGDAVLFGLPGNPVAVMVAFLVFVRPALLRLSGCHAAATAAPPLLRARSIGAVRKRPGRTEYQRGFVSTGIDGRPAVRVAANQGSGVLSSMVEANALVVLNHDRSDVADGDDVDVLMFDGVL